MSIGKKTEKEIIALGRTTALFIRDHFQKKDFDEETKDHDNSLVSFVDREAEELITDGLSNLFPDYGFITEEDTILQDDQKEYYWIIDPLDGTTNFIHGLEVFSVSIALADNKHRLVWGLVVDVMKDDVFYDSRGRGAWKNNQRLRPAPSSLKNSLIATGFPYYRFVHKNAYLKYLEGFMNSCRGMRRCGSAALDMVHVASGTFGGFFEFDLHLWDVAAGALILQEAGGIVTDFHQDKEAWKKSGHIVAGNPICHREMFEKVISS